MPIHNFEGDTFLAFLDISGFIKLMKEEKAFDTLKLFYQTGYDTLRDQQGSIDGLFISDCGIIFCRIYGDERASLRSLLKVTKNINKKMLQRDLMLTTSIAYGRFSYHQRIEFDGISKNPIYGQAYVSAYFDNENGKPKIEPGQCRIIKENLPNDIKDFLESETQTNIQGDNIFKMIQKRKRDNKHYYFYWMRDDPREIEDFEKQYMDSKYRGMLMALNRRW